jgi:DNA-binding NtrC family response regulator
MSEKKILVFSENESLRKKIIEFLVIASPDYIGFGISTLAGIDQQLAQNGPFGVLITEYKFDKFNGFDVINKMRKSNKDTVVIMIPEREQITEIQTELSKNPVHDILCKPLNMKYLQQVIKMGLKD